MDAPRFEEATHTYWVGSRRVTGITQALEIAGIRPKPAALMSMPRFRENFNYAGERGTALHKMRHLSDIGEAGRYDFDPNLKGYLDAWDAFKKEWGFTPTFSEKWLIHPILMFGGTPDAAGYCERLGRIAVVEAKTCELVDWVGVQLALQKVLLCDIENMAVVDRLGVKVTAEGKYSAVEYRSHIDRGVGLSAVTCANWRLNHE